MPPGTTSGTTSATTRRPWPARPERTVAYAAGVARSYDVWGASPTRRTTVALVHGGFWRAAYDRAHLTPLAAALAADGYGVAVLEYSRVGMPGGGWPGTGLDVAAGLRAVVADPALPDRVVAVGHSAGGHLVAWAAGSGMADGLAGVVCLAGVVDLGLADRLGLGDGAVAGLLGGPGLAARPEPDPARLPPRPGPWTVLLHGLLDEDVPIEISRSFLASRAAGATACRLVELRRTGHFDLIDPGHAAYRVLRKTVDGDPG